jgi:hypothetical protein
MGMEVIKKGANNFIFTCLFRVKLTLPTKETIKFRDRDRDMKGMETGYKPKIAKRAVYDKPPPSSTDE